METLRKLLRQSFRWYLPLLSSLAIMTLGLSCKGNRSDDTNGKLLAQVSIDELDSVAYENYEIKVYRVDPNDQLLLQKSFPRGRGVFELKLPVGRYRFIVDYYLASKLVYSTSACSIQEKNEVQDLKLGTNRISLNVCNLQSQAINPGQANPQRTFRVENGMLIDPIGKPFVMRGINSVHNYYPVEAYDSLPKIKALGFNTVRIVWCMPEFRREDRCKEKDEHSLEYLEKILMRLKELKLVGVFNLQNATGSNSSADLLKVVEYYKSVKVRELLSKYQDTLLINIANEWYGTWDSNPIYVNTYKTAVDDLRKAGYQHVLIVDAPGYGQDPNVVKTRARAIAELDKNLLLSLHLYDVYDTDEKVSAVFKSLREQKVPFMVGEFSHSHGPGKPVAWQAILREAESGPVKISTIIWSYSGNNSALEDLDFVSNKDWTTVSDWGKKMLDDTYGIRASSKQACYFDPNMCR